MKYKAKFTGYNSFLVPILKEGDTIDSEGQKYVFIPFNDTNFFEPVKVRKFVIEVPEENMDKFNFYVNDGDPAWTVTEVTEPSSLIKLKENPDVSKEIIELLSDKSNLEKVIKAYAVAFATNAEQGKLEVIKHLKYWLVNNFPAISELKHAKSIVDSWW